MTLGTMHVPYSATWALWLSAERFGFGVFRLGFCVADESASLVDSGLRVSNLFQNLRDGCKYSV